MALLNNPLSELIAPLSRTERAVTELADEISAVQALPRIEVELGELRATLTESLELMRAVVAEVGRIREASQQIVLAQERGVGG